LLKEGKKLELPGTVYKRKCITSVRKNGYRKKEQQGHCYYLKVARGDPAVVKYEARSTCRSSYMLRNGWSCVEDNRKGRVR